MSAVRTQKRAPLLVYVALALAIVPCCPFVSLAGGFLGLLALGRMHRGGFRRDAPGRKIAIAAAITGLLVSIATTGAFTWWQQGLNDSFREEATTEVEQVMHAAMRSDLPTVRQVWSPNPAAPADETILAFGKELHARYGRFQRFAIDSFAFEGLPSAPRIDMSGVFTFETRQLPGSAQLVLVPHPGTLAMDFALVKILIEDRAAGNLELPSP